MLLPTSINKLLAQWQGPYCILQRVGKVNYEVTDKRKRKKVIHVNMLKKWFPPVGSSFWVTEDTEMEDEEFVSTWQDQGGGTPAIGNQLSKEQKWQLDDLLAKFKTVMSGECGRITVCQHHIGVKCDIPVHQQPYRLPNMHRERGC